MMCWMILGSVIWCVLVCICLIRCINVDNLVFVVLVRYGIDVVSEMLYSCVVFCSCFSECVFMLCVGKFIMWLNVVLLLGFLRSWRYVNVCLIFVCLKKCRLLYIL